MTRIRRALPVSPAGFEADAGSSGGTAPRESDRICRASAQAKASFGKRTGQVLTMGLALTRPRATAASGCGFGVPGSGNDMHAGL